MEGDWLTTRPPQPIADKLGNSAGQQDEIRKSMDNFTNVYFITYKQFLHLHLRMDLPVLFVNFTVFTGTITDCPFHPKGH